MQPTDKQISAALDAWERTVTEWRVRRVNNYGLDHDVWFVERRVGSVFDPSIGREIENQIAYHKFYGETAERQARLLLRDKCIRAALEAALNATP